MVNDPSEGIKVSKRAAIYLKSFRRRKCLQKREGLEVCGDYAWSELIIKAKSAGMSVRPFF